ncbi:hypothetical protein PV327_006161 [Microctonus hyperodae]|uniref:Uncharacterized protein n=1 Tax=Microctonus hyperodae TaxID=165561 RepID=A0AA39L0G6_MICHY|nr:hypothetical protein PV327_006161 [Microctonus hyperodae]
MKNIKALLYFSTILVIQIISESFAMPFPVPDSSFVFPGPSTSENFNPSEHSYGDKFKGHHFNGYKIRHPKPYSSIVHDCGGYRCNFEDYGSRPNHEIYYSQDLPSGDNLATMFTQTSGLPNHPVSTDDSGPIINQANAQTATFNFGPFSVSFSTSNSLSIADAPTKEPASFPWALLSSRSHFSCGCRLEKYPRDSVEKEKKRKIILLGQLDIYPQMAKFLALLVIASICVTFNVQGQKLPNEKPVIGQAFDEIVVSSDLNIRRKSKENRQGKKILMNVPSGTTGPPGKSTRISSRLMSSDESEISAATREQRDLSEKSLLDFDVAEYLLKSRKR